MKRLIYLLVVAVLTTMLTGCDDDHEIVPDGGHNELDRTDKYDMYYNPSVMGRVVGYDVDIMPPKCVMLHPNTKVRLNLSEHPQEHLESFRPINLMAVTLERYVLKESETEKTRYKNLHEWVNCDSAKVFGKIISKQEAIYAPRYEFEVTDDLNGVYSDGGVTITWNDEYIEVSTDRNFVPTDKYWNLYIRNGICLSVFPIFFNPEGLYDFEYTYAYYIRDLENGKK